MNSAINKLKNHNYDIYDINDNDGIDFIAIINENII
jgi:hypothetical protein